MAQITKVVPTVKSNAMDYCAILADPFDEDLNARIPDECNLPSRAYSTFTEGTFTANDQGWGGIHVRINVQGANATYALEGPTSGTGGPPVAIVFGADQAFPGVITTANTVGSRIVAAGLKVEMMSGDPSMTGVIYSAYKHRLQTPQTPLTRADLLSSPNGGFGASKYGAFSVYRPIDVKDNQYSTTTDWGALMQIHVECGQQVPNVGSTSYVLNPRPTFKYKIVLHYEILPASDSSALVGQLAYGPHDNEATKLVDTLARTVPQVGSGSTTQTVTEFFVSLSNRFKQLYRQASQAISSRPVKYAARSAAGLAGGYLANRSRMRSFHSLPFGNGVYRRSIPETLSRAIQGFTRVTNSPISGRTRAALRNMRQRQNKM